MNYFFKFLSGSEIDLNKLKKNSFFSFTKNKILLPEKFKLIPASYQGNDFMKIQCDEKDLVKKLEGEFHMFETKSFGLSLLLTLDDPSIIDEIHELVDRENKSENKNISLSMNKTTPFVNQKKNIIDQTKT